MPYFIRKQDGKFCVFKGTEDAPEGLEKCHVTHEDALAHMKALYASVEDVKSDSSDKANAASENVSSNLMHGSDGILSPMRGGETCTCPSCDHETKKVPNVPCSEQKCPECGTAMTEEEEVEKAEMESSARNNLPDSSFLYIEPGGKKDESGKTTPRNLRHLPYKDASGDVDLSHLRNAISRLSQSATGTGEDSWLTASLRSSLLAKARKLLQQHQQQGKSLFHAYKSHDGSWRWMSVSNVAIKDREGETISEKAYDDAIAWAQENGYGELDLVHIKGTDVGTCDMTARLGKLLIESGTWYDDERAVRVRRAVSENPDYWGVSIKFRYDPEQFEEQTGTYHGGMQLLKRTILPRRMAASFGTAIAVTGGEKMKQIDEEAKNALRELGVGDEEIAALSEQQKSLEPEPNVKTKEEDRPSLVSMIKSMVSSVLREQAATPDVAEQPEVEKDEAQTETEAEVQTQKAEKEVQPDTTPAQGTPPVTADEMSEALKNFGNVVAKVVAEQVAELQVSYQGLETKLTDMEKRLAQAEASVEEKVLARLSELPPVVKVSPTAVAPVEQVEATRPTIGPAPAPRGKRYASALVEDIDRVVKNYGQGAKYNV